MLLLLSTPDATPTPAPVTTTEDGGAMWGPWKPIKPRPLVRGRVVIRIAAPRLAVSGNVHEDEDWLLLIP